jgi:hypothetical protein
LFPTANVTSIVALTKEIAADNDVVELMRSRVGPHVFRQVSKEQCGGHGSVRRLMHRNVRACREFHRSYPRSSSGYLTTLEAQGSDAPSTPGYRKVTALRIAVL